MVEIYEPRKTTTPETGKGRLSKKEVAVLKEYGYLVVDPDFGK